MSLRIIENKSSFESDITACCIRDGFLFFLHDSVASIYAAKESNKKLLETDFSCRIFEFCNQYFLLTLDGLLYSIDQDKGEVNQILEAMHEGIGFINKNYYSKRFSQRNPEKVIWRDVFNFNHEKVATLHNDATIKYVDKEVIIVSDVGLNAPIRRVKDDFTTDVWSYSRYGEVRTGPLPVFRKGNKLFTFAYTADRKASVLCLDIHTGEKVWQTECKVGFFYNYPASPYFVGLDEGFFTLLDSRTGEVLQKRQLVGTANSAYNSYLQGDKFYFLNDHGSKPILESVNIHTLEQFVELDLVTDPSRYEGFSLSGLFKRPVVEHGKVFIPTHANEMYIYDMEDLQSEKK